jgi:hypothetical protein
VCPIDSQRLQVVGGPGHSILRDDDRVARPGSDVLSSHVLQSSFPCPTSCHSAAGASPGAAILHIVPVASTVCCDGMAPFLSFLFVTYLVVDLLKRCPTSNAPHSVESREVCLVPAQSLSLLLRSKRPEKSRDRLAKVCNCSFERGRLFKSMRPSSLARISFITRASYTLRAFVFQLISRCRRNGMPLSRERHFSNVSEAARRLQRQTV